MIHYIYMEQYREYESKLGTLADGCLFPYANNRFDPSHMVMEYIANYNQS